MLANPPMRVKPFIPANSDLLWIPHLSVVVFSAFPTVALLIKLYVDFVQLHAIHLSGQQFSVYTLRGVFSVNRTVPSALKVLPPQYVDSQNTLFYKQDTKVLINILLQLDKLVGFTLLVFTFCNKTRT